MSESASQPILPRPRDLWWRPQGEAYTLDSCVSKARGNKFLVTNSQLFIPLTLTGNKYSIREMPFLLLP